MYCLPLESSEALVFYGPISPAPRPPILCQRLPTHLSLVQDNEDQPPTPSEEEGE